MMGMRFENRSDENGGVEGQLHSIPLRFGTLKLRRRCVDHVLEIPRIKTDEFLAFVNRVADRGFKLDDATGDFKSDIDFAGGLGFAG